MEKSEKSLFQHCLEEFHRRCDEEEQEWLNTCEELAELYDYENEQLEQSFMGFV